MARQHKSVFFSEKFGQATECTTLYATKSSRHRPSHRRRPPEPTGSLGLRGAHKEEAKNS